MPPTVDELLTVVSSLGADELAVVVAVARRLALGAKLYGPLDIHGDARDWRREASEEALDAAGYLACQTMREGRR